jgi:hypothetical protein
VADAFASWDGKPEGSPVIAQLRMARELGVDHFAVSVQLGHTDGGALVMARYGHLSEARAKQRVLDLFDRRGENLSQNLSQRR